MQLIPSNELDHIGWDRLVRRSGGSAFSLSAYLEATADNWAVLMFGNYEGGIICPFSVKLGVKILYAPFFHRYTEWIGEGKPPYKTLIAELQRHFQVADAHLFFPEEAGDKKHQVVSAETFMPNQQAKRMLKKATVFTVGESADRKHEEQLLTLIRHELGSRIAGIDDHSLGILRRLLQATNDIRLPLRQLDLFQNGEWKGGLWLVPYNSRMLYLKGTVEADAKRNGGMYALMEHAQQLAFSQNMLFDFGGSNAEGVRRFNLNWGAQDVFYHHLRWNNAPLPWKILKSAKQLWNR